MKKRRKLTGDSRCESFDRNNLGPEDYVRGAPGNTKAIRKLGHRGGFEPMPKTSSRGVIVGKEETSDVWRI